MSSLSQIPKRLGSTLTPIAPVQEVTPSTLRYKIATAQTSIWTLPTRDMQNACQNYLNLVEKDVINNINEAYTLIEQLLSSINALDRSVSKDDATLIVQDLVDNINQVQTKFSNAVIEQQDANAALSDKKHTISQLKVINQLLWDTTENVNNILALLFGEISNPILLTN